jgi:hypothetical protein
MTIIAYRDGIMAGDTLVSSDEGQFVGFDEKVVKNLLGALWGAMGDNGECHRCCEWFLKAKGLVDLHAPPRFSDGQGLIVFPDGDVFTVYDGYARQSIEHRHFGYTAIGAGCDFALGAMAMGATAEQAVKVAIDFSLLCGGEIHSVRLDSVGATNGPA